MESIAAAKASIAELVGGDPEVDEAGPHQDRKVSVTYALSFSHSRPAAIQPVEIVVEHRRVHLGQTDQTLLGLLPSLTSRGSKEVGLFHEQDLWDDVLDQRRSDQDAQSLLVLHDFCGDVVEPRGGSKILARLCRSPRFDKARKHCPEFADHMELSLWERA